MKIARVKHHGQTRHRVNDPQVSNGKRQRLFFATRATAEEYVKTRKAEVAAFGVRFTTIPPNERAAIAFHLQRLESLGWTLSAAVNFIEQHGKASPSVTLGTVAAEFLAAKQTAGLRPRYVKTLRASIDRFVKSRRNKAIAGITPAEIQEYITGKDWRPATMRSYLVDVRTLFAFAVKRKYIRENPGLAVDLPRVEQNAPGILTPEQTSAILDACIDTAPDILPVIALSLFGGLRRSEAEKLEWAEISAEFVEIKAHKTKTRQRRLIPISGQLRAWLDTARAIAGKLPAINYAEKLKRVLEKTQLQAEWPQNALRHSFASYHFAKHKNENETAALMGNSPQMVFQHYRELVRPADADAFFALIPPPDAVARPTAARAHRLRIMPPREVKITAEVMATVFDGGRLTLTRKEAVAALVSHVRCSVAAAYNALAPESRFKAHLVEAAGNLTWRQEATPAAA